MSEFQEKADDLVTAIENNDNEAAKLAFTAIIVEVGTLFERGVVALEALAGTVCPAFDRPAIRTRKD